MKYKLFLLGFFIISAPALILGEIFLLTNKSFSQITSKKIISPIAAVDYSQSVESTKQILSPKEAQNSSMDTTIVGADARPFLMKAYLDKYSSPLAAFSDLIFDVSQKYGVDYRLIVAIAQQESNLCKKSPPNCFNCWGVGIHSRGTMCFDDYPQGIEFMGNYLRTEYLDKGRQTPEEIMGKYCPLSDGSWAFGVRQFMADME
ncbi:MAG: hypothetical protein HQ547_07375 [Candidatus Omnitrophica bacterium]|nr:hypothetical protein [Candidatus Omnitrophota bacterium]